jgi:type IV pilus assembly protein PilM
MCGMPVRGRFLPAQTVQQGSRLKGQKLNWKRLLGLKFGDLLGLDIGSSSVKLVQFARSGGEYETVAAGKVRIEAEGDKNLQAAEIRTVRAITDCYQQAGIANRYAVCSVCGPDVAVRYFKFPLIPAEELASAVALEAEQVCPFSMEDSVLDYQIIPDGGESIHGVLVAATNKVIRHKEKMMKEASLNPVMMDVDGLALLNCLSKYGDCESNQAMAVLNVGSIYSTLVIAGEKCVPFVRDTSHAGTSVIKNLVQKTGLSRKELDEILFGDESGYGPEKDDGRTESRKLVENSLEEACQDLIEDVTGTLRFYSAQRKTLFVEKIFVCGGFARACGFIDILDKNLPAQAVLWNPFDKIPCRADNACKVLLKKEGPSLAVAAGLAMRSI